MPVNRKMRELIIERADLLVESEVPQPLKDFCAHVSSLEVVLAAEKDGARVGTLIQHPGAAFVTYVENSYLDLKKEQRRLLGNDASSVSRIPKASIGTKPQASVRGEE
jgi:hypothetical protein